MSNKKYYKYINIIRIILCIFILFYHLGILKNGYLAVCSFFVLSGYLAVKSAFKKEEFYITDYYKSRLLKLYLPLMVVVFISIAIISFFPDIIWLNLKKETTSVIFGFNNFWQLLTNQDYFARSVNSPFIHLWYISILFQFDLIFPYIFLFFKKISEKVDKKIVIFILVLISTYCGLYFYKSSVSIELMNVYYNTFTRIFSILFGLTLGFINEFYGSKVLKNSKINFYVYFLILSLIFIIDLGLDYNILMILVTFITMRIIDYASSLEGDINKSDNIIKSLFNVSYEIYLVQYPIIFLFQYVNIQNNIKIVIIILITLLVSYLIRYILEFNREKRILKIILRILTLLFCLYGFFVYIFSKDYTNEMKELEAKLNENEEAMKLKQIEYEEELKKANDLFESELNELYMDDEKLHQMVTNMSVVGLGDSVMLGAINDLYNVFPKGYFDAGTSRTAWVANGILQDLQKKNLLKNTIIMNYGSNGDCPESCKIKIMETCKGKDVFWINTTINNRVHVNEKLIALSKKYSNLHIIDWETESKGHKDYFISDGLHLTTKGREVYANFIYNSIYEFYKDKYKKEYEEKLNQHNEELKQMISFYGNDLLLNVFNFIKDDFSNAKFDVNDKYNYHMLKENIINSKKDGSINYKVVLVFDKMINMNKNDYLELFEILNDNEIYILTTNKKVSEELSKINNINIIDFEVKNEYFLPDKVHLNDLGNSELKNIIIKNLILNN